MIEKLKKFFKRDDVSEVLLNALYAIITIVTKNKIMAQLQEQNKKELLAA